jgi:hypothetical protein
MQDQRCENLLWQNLERWISGPRVINSSKIQSEALEKLLKSERLIRELIYGGECCVSRVRVLVVAAGGKRVDSATSGGKVRLLLSTGVKNALPFLPPEYKLGLGCARCVFA